MYMYIYIYTHMYICIYTCVYVGFLEGLHDSFRKLGMSSNSFEHLQAQC